MGRSLHREKKGGEQKRKANDSDTNFYLMDLRLVGDVPLFLSNSVECRASGIIHI